MAAPEGLLPDGLEVKLVHCAKVMLRQGGGVTWEGETEITHGRYQCVRCGLKIEVRAFEHVGPPVGL